jgi:hypothetical protein
MDEIFRKVYRFGADLGLLLLGLLMTHFFLALIRPILA